MRHIIPCCRGECTACGKHIIDFKKHQETCRDAEEHTLAILREFQRNTKPRLNFFRATKDPEDRRLFVVRNGVLYGYDGETWSRMPSLLPDDFQRDEVRSLDD